MQIVILFATPSIPTISTVLDVSIAYVQPWTIRPNVTFPIEIVVEADMKNWEDIHLRNIFHKKCMGALLHQSELFSFKKCCAYSGSQQRQMLCEIGYYAVFTNRTDVHVD